MPAPTRFSISSARWPQVLDCFQTGRKTVLSTMLRPRIDRILLAATKADHLHHTSHDRLEAS